MTGVRVMGIGGSGTPLEKEARDVDEALQRACARVTTFDRDAYDPRAVARAREAWRQRMAFEHRSTTVFSNLATQLFEANATLDEKLVMLRMAQDEIRHTVTCGEVVAALGGTPTFAAEVDVAPLARHRGCSAEERALRNVLYTTCLSEMVAVARLVDELEATRDPFLHDATRRLLADEVLHGQYGFHYLSAWQPWLAAHPDVVASLERYLQHAFAVIEPLLAPASDEPGRALEDDDIALGLVPEERSRQVFYDTVTHAIVPGLERLGLDASRAWRERIRLDVDVA